MSADIQSEEDLRHWLANEDWYFSRHTRTWLERTPTEEAVEMLAKVAEDAALEPRSLGNVLARMVITAGLTPGGALAGSGPPDRKAGTRAALLLAHLGDARAVPALVRVWDARESHQSQYHELIEAALLRYFSDPAHDADLLAHADTVRDLARRLWQPDTLRKDLTPATADLLIAARRHLERWGSADDHILLREITAADTRAPQRRRVQEAFRDSPTTRDATPTSR